MITLCSCVCLFSGFPPADYLHRGVCSQRNNRQLSPRDEESLSFLIPSIKQRKTWSGWRKKREIYWTLLYRLIPAVCNNSHRFLRKTVSLLLCHCLFYSKPFLRQHLWWMSVLVFLRVTGWQFCIFPFWQRQDEGTAVKPFQDVTKRERVGGAGVWQVWTWVWSRFLVVFVCCSEMWVEGIFAGIRESKCNLYTWMHQLFDIVKHV